MRTNTENQYIPGDNWVICQMCGFRRRASECRMNYNGLLVCSDTCWEPRHEQEFYRAPREQITIRNPRPEPTDVFIEDRSVTPDDL